MSAVALDERPFLRLPHRETLFRERALRLEALAQGHPMGDYLLLLGRLAGAQQKALERLPAVPLPDADHLARARTHAMPPLPAQGWERDPAWREALETILRGVVESSPPPVQAAIERLRGMAAAALEALADQVLAGGEGQDPLLAPLVAAALQVYWSHMAAHLTGYAPDQADPPGLCPVCGSPPVVSVVQTAGGIEGLRYLHCSLCQSEWHLSRIQCTHCADTTALSYYVAEGAGKAVKAEACDSCHGYLKILYREKDHRLEGGADDLATLALDVLMAEAGYGRSGPNLLFVPGRD